jgi:hypothetical protein
MMRFLAAPAKLRNTGRYEVDLYFLDSSTRFFNNCFSMSRRMKKPDQFDITALGILRLFFALMLGKVLIGAGSGGGRIEIPK